MKESWKTVSKITITKPCNIH